MITVKAAQDRSLTNKYCSERRRALFANHGEILRRPRVPCDLATLLKR